ncbi:MAG: hypothetical protein P4L42_05145 [Desulfocapsaceae bacterium]|nr:hypothetical protein [Desulfocapsaceae bacterium]
MEDLSTMLTFEIKKEIADRYFGFRKIIEEDTQLFRQNIIALSLDLENSIGFDLVRIYTLLQEDDLIHSFFQISGLCERFFFDSYINKSAAIRKRLFTGQKLRGFTRRSRFINMCLDTYSLLHDHILDYRTALCRLTDDHDTLREEINLFYRKNDISGIMQFLRGLGFEEDSAGLAGPLQTGVRCCLDDKLRLSPPDPVAELLPAIPAIPPLKDVRKVLKDVVLVAWSRQPGRDLRSI